MSPPTDPQRQQPTTNDNVHGDKVTGNKIDGDQITANVDNSQNVAIGRGAKVINYGLTIDQVQ